MFVPYVPPPQVSIPVNSAEFLISSGSAPAHEIPRVTPSVLTEFDKSIVVLVRPTHCMSS